MNQQELRRLALAGVEAEIAKLTKLRADLLSGKTAAAIDGATKGRRAKRRGRRRFTAAQRKEVSKRMKAMWAARRKK